MFSMQKPYFYWRLGQMGFKLNPCVMVFTAEESRERKKAADLAMGSI